MTFKKLKSNNSEEEETKNKLEEWRGEIIEKMINIELLINITISQYYIHTTNTEFIFDILYDEYFTLGLKIKILKKALKRYLEKKKMNQIKEKKENEWEKENEKMNQIFEKLGRLKNIRNHFAHLSPVFYSKKNQNGIAPLPNKLDKKINFSKEYKEFKKLEPKVSEYLFNIFKELGGVAKKMVIDLSNHKTP